MASEQPDGLDVGKRSPFRVLGIALVVDQLGKGARMILRYPSVSLTADTEDLFFRLPPRQVAKLFRPKPALCGQPMTLSVGGTVFCCRAILMEDNAEDKQDDATENKDSLVLFSLIVALAPQIKTSSIPISGWFEENAEEQLEMQASLSMLEGKFGPSSSENRASASFLSIRRIHVSLARLCRVLEREERRCRYVSLQSNLFAQIRNDTQKKLQSLHEQFKSSPNSKTASSTTSPASLHSKTSQAGGGRHHRRSSSFTNYDRELNKERPSVVPVVSPQQQQEWEQEVMEVFMAAVPPTDPDTGVEHQGNLVRELVQVYHALARNDHDFHPTPSTMLTERDSIVYINRHIAVVVEAVSPGRFVSISEQTMIRPYHTVLFPHASPSELLEALSTPGSVAPRRLQQLLLTVNPQKSLTDIAVEANLPLQATMELVTSLTEQGVCIPSPVLSRNSRLACRDIEMISEMSLAFSQVFGSSISMFLLVSFLSESGWTLGEAMTALRESEEDDIIWLRERMEASLPVRTASLGDIATPGQVETFVESPMGVHQHEWATRRSAEDLEAELFRIAIWLVSHKVLTQLEEYLVASTLTLSADGDQEDEAVPSSSSLHTETKVDGGIRSDSLTDDVLYKELADLDCLSGKVSLQACSWRTGVLPSKLRAFALRHDQVRIISRIPAPGDDWDTV